MIKLATFNKFTGEPFDRRFHFVTRHADRKKAVEHASMLRSRKDVTHARVTSSIEDKDHPDGRFIVWVRTRK